MTSPNQEPPMTEKHTPTPWELIDVLGNVTVMAGDIQLLSYYSPAPVNRANAALIVRAVNSHEQLVSALKLVSKAMDELMPGLPNLACDVGLINDACIAMNRALQSAGESHE